jgi:hypothetical protein
LKNPEIHFFDRCRTTSGIVFFAVAICSLLIARTSLALVADFVSGNTRIPARFSLFAGFAALVNLCHSRPCAQAIGRKDNSRDQNHIE